MEKIKALFAPRDLTKGSPMKGIVLFAIPLLIGNLVQQLYSTADAAVVGRFVGDQALGAVGQSFTLVNLMLVLFIGISTGAGIVVSQYFGARDREAQTRTVGTTLILTFWSGLFVTVVGALTARPLLVLLNTPAEMLDMAADYLQIIFLGFLFCAYYNILGGILRGLGDSVTPLIYLIVAALLNVVLDLLFVAVFHMGTAGAAWATILSQAISAVLCFLKLRSMTEILEVSRKTLKVDKPIMRRIMGLGVPSGVTQMIFSLSGLLVQSLTNSLGAYVVTASTAVMRVDGFAMMPNFTFAIAATTFTGQNVGAKRMDRVEQGAKATLKVALITATALTGLILIFGRALMGMFTQTEAVLELGISMMRILAVGYIAFGVTQTLMGVMRGAGETVKPMWISMITTVVVRLPIAYAWAALTRTAEYPNGDPLCLYGSLLVAWLFGCVATAIVYRRGTWKKKCGLEGGEPNAEGPVLEGGY